MLILKFHEKYHHSGVNATLNLLRTKLWIICGWKTVKKYLKKRVTCKIVQGKTLKPPECPSFKSIDLKNFLLKGSIKWQFILEKLSWLDGFYERLTGIVKNSLKKVIGKALCNYEQLTTYICETESN